MQTQEFAANTYRNSTAGWATKMVVHSHDHVTVVERPSEHVHCGTTVPKWVAHAKCRQTERVLVDSDDLKNRKNGRSANT